MFEGEGAHPPGEGGHLQGDAGVPPHSLGTKQIDVPG